MFVNTVGKLDEFFLLWLSTPTTQTYIKQIISELVNKPHSPQLNNKSLQYKSPSTSPIKPRSLFNEDQENVDPQHLIKAKSLVSMKPSQDAIQSKAQVFILVMRFTLINYSQRRRLMKSKYRNSTFRRTKMNKEKSSKSNS